jgi:PDZ domain-containing protein
MAGTGRRPAPDGRPGLTLIELLAAIALTGTVLTLLLPRLAPGPEPAPAGYESTDRCPFVGTVPMSEPEVAERGFIGVQLGPTPTWDGYVWIRQPLPGRPAQAAGVLPGDAILRVDGFPARNRRVEEIVEMITRGRAGTPVRLTVRQLGSANTRELRIRRGSFLSVFLPGFSRYWDPQEESRQYLVGE